MVSNKTKLFIRIKSLYLIYMFRAISQSVYRLPALLNNTVILNIHNIKYLQLVTSLLTVITMGSHWGSKSGSKVSAGTSLLLFYLVLGDWLSSGLPHFTTLWGSPSGEESFWEYFIISILFS